MLIYEGEGPPFRPELPFPDLDFKSTNGAILTPGARGTLEVAEGVVTGAIATVVLAEAAVSPASLCTSKGSVAAAFVAALLSICSSNPDEIGCCCCASASIGLATSGADQRRFRLGTGIVVARISLDDVTPEVDEGVVVAAAWLSNTLVAVVGMPAEDAEDDETVDKVDVEVVEGEIVCVGIDGEGKVAAP